MSELEPISPLVIEAKSAFQEFLDQIEGWQEKVKTIIVETIHDKAAMQKAKELRLEIRSARTSADKRRKEMKADSIAYGKAIQSMYDLVEKATKPLEAELEDKEKFEQRQEEARIQEIGGNRLEALTPFLRDGEQQPEIKYLADMDIVMFEDTLTGYKKRHAEHLEMLKKQADAVNTAKENEELAAKNAQLKADAEEQAEEIAKKKALVEAAEQRLGELRELLPILEWRDGTKSADTFHDPELLATLEKWMGLLSDAYEMLAEVK